MLRDFLGHGQLKNFVHQIFELIKHPLSPIKRLHDLLGFIGGRLNASISTQPLSMGGAHALASNLVTQNITTETSNMDVLCSNTDDPANP